MNSLEQAAYRARHELPVSEVEELAALYEDLAQDPALGRPEDAAVAAEYRRVADSR